MSSVSREHAEWRSLVEVSGPFLAMEVLLRTFPQGLPSSSDEKEVRARLRSAHAEWEAAQEESQGDAALHQAWVRFILGELLELPEEALRQGQSLPQALSVHVAEHGETLRPDLALLDGETPRLLVSVWGPGQDLERAPRDHRWPASPAARMMTLLHATGVRLGLVTNGETWMLVHAHPGATTTYAMFYADLWLSEPLTFRAFRALLGVHRFFGVPEEESLEALFRQSTEYQHEVTDQLGYQVRRAVEVLIQAIDHIDRDQKGRLLKGVDVRTLYESAVTVMMRLVFLLCAEERKLLLAGNPLYDEHYAIGTLRDQLRAVADRHGEEILERRRGAWARLLATFRAVYGGVQHQDFALRAYGGSLFDPDRYPFLEGRPAGTSWRDTEARPLPLHDRTVLHLLDSIQMLEIRVRGGGPAEAQRLSFRALDVEQIGNVYEGLLDHTAKRAEAPVLGLQGSKNREPEIPLDTLMKESRKGREHLVTFLRDQTGRSAKALEGALEYQLEQEDERLLVACEGQELYGQVEKWAGLLRTDTNGYPAVFPKGSVYVTQGTDRRSTGTHYTPPSLTEPLVRHTLEPLVYEGPAEGKPREEWKLKSPEALLSLRVCDVAMGSGAFLVQACRYLAERLVEAWATAEERTPGLPLFAPGAEESRGRPYERLLPKDPQERLTLARRVVADRCLYGVDRNHMAVEMAKLSLWLTTMQKDRPFTFLDHALKCGDSLLGVTNLEQLARFDLRPGQGRNSILGSGQIEKWLAFATEHRERLERIPVLDVKDTQTKTWLLEEAERQLAPAKVIADLVVGATLATKPQQLDGVLAELAIEAGGLLETKRPEDREVRLNKLSKRTREMMEAGREPGQPERRTFHWVLEFPEVFARKDASTRGFDAVISNPPFMGGRKITGELGTDYRDFLVENVGNGKRASTADLCAYFFLRAHALLRGGGYFGLIATNTIAQGDTREVGLDHIHSQGSTIYRAVQSEPWPGTAALEVAHVWVCKGSWLRPFILKDTEVPAITTQLTPQGRTQGNPYRLVENASKSFQGSIVLGMGFILEPDEAQTLITKNKKNKDVLFPYLNGEDLNSTTNQAATRWVINFHDWPLNRKTKESSHSGRVAEDYPDVLNILIEKGARDHRQGQKGDVAAAPWWRFWRIRSELYASIANQQKVIVTSLVSKYWMPCKVPNGQVFSHRLGVFSDISYALLQSIVHEAWARKYSSTLETRLNYTPTDCFETFPRVNIAEEVEAIGRKIS
ncbi:Eco57I restriction-modification methylase domain-containing protein [Archangium violaceum]|uniref:Eco57I restriction-modification methylase domain-containing protein n=1 Tax=Archangium violaceum TaxID=83451 RepID=UPI0036DE404A